VTPASIQRTGLTESGYKQSTGDPTPISTQFRDLPQVCQFTGFTAASTLAGRARAGYTLPRVQRLTFTHSRNLMRSILAAGVFALLAAGVEAQDAKTFESKEGKYTVNFPGKPTTNTSKAGGIDLNITIVEKGGGGYAVIHSDLPAEGVKAAKAKDLLDGGEKGLVTNFKAKVTSSKDFEFGKQKLPARELVAEKDPLNLRIQIILSGNRLYQVFVVGSKDMVASKETDAFFKSFEITK
jgi:hypothetical protein